MSALTVTLLRFGFLALLWLFVAVAVAVLRRDIYGTKITPRRAVPAPGPAPSPASQAVSQPVAAPPLASPRPEPARADNSRSFALIVTGGPLTGTTIPLSGGPVRIGRAPANTLVLDDSYASSNHARIEREQDVFVVEDLGSTNGTYLGGERLQGRRRIDPGVELRIGNTTIELRR